jgi:putative ABC transport system permease protein
VPSLVVRSRLPTDAIAATIRRRIEAHDPQLLVHAIRPMGDVVSGALARPRFNLIVLGAFALLALLLSTIGIYGVLSLLVSQRTREIGIRMALGAHTRHIARLVLREGMAPVMVGSIGGMLAAVAATRAMRSMLFGVSTLDAPSFIGAPAVLAGVALLACYIPARRATRVDPIVALREE